MNDAFPGLVWISIVDLLLHDKDKFHPEVSGPSTKFPWPGRQTILNDPDVLSVWMTKIPNPKQSVLEENNFDSQSDAEILLRNYTKLLQLLSYGKQLM